MKKRFINVLVIMVLAVSLCLMTATPATAVETNQNTPESSTMIFQGSLTDNPDGSYTGSIPMTEGEYYVVDGDGESVRASGGFDVYARQGAEAYVLDYYGSGDWNGPGGDDTYIIGFYTDTDHDAYPFPGGPWGGWWNPDCADWSMYSLELTADHWYLRYTPTGESPMSGAMDWAARYAAETDKGTEDLEDDGVGPYTVYEDGGPAMWDWNAGAQVERIPLAFPGFDVDIVDIGGGNFTVTLTPAASNNPPGPVVNADNGESYGTIQAAIDAASPGDTINVWPGTYDIAQQIIIDKALNLIGTEAATTIINGPGDSADIPYIGPAPGNCPGLVAIDGVSGEVSIKNFTLQGAPAQEASGNTELLVVRNMPAGASATIENNIFIGRDDSSVVDEGIWIAEGDASSAVTIKNNDFSKMSWMAICLERMLGASTVEDNIIHDLVVTVYGGDIYPPYGLYYLTYLDDTTGNVTTQQLVKGNTFTGFTGQDIQFWGGHPLGDGKFTDVKIQNNIIDAIGSGSVEEHFGIALYNDSSGDSSICGVHNVEISGNNITTGGADSKGIIIDGYNTGIDIFNNTITSLGTGISMESAEGGTVITANTFDGNEIQVSDDTGTLDIAAILAGNDLDRAVTVDHPGASLLPTIWSNIQDGIDNAVAGDLVEAAPGNYVEAILIDKPLTLRGATAGVNKNGYVVPADYAWDPADESIIMHPNPAAGYITIVDIYDVDNVVFEGFVVQELNAEANLNSSLVRVRAQTQEVNNVIVRNNIIGPNTNVAGQDGTHGRMGLYLVNNPYSDLYGIVDSTFSGNKIFDCQGNGNNIFLWSSYSNPSYGAPGPASMSGTVIEDNEIYGAHRSGIETAGGYSGLTIRNNKIYDKAGSPGDDPPLKYGNGMVLIRGSGDSHLEDNPGLGPVDLTIEGNEIYDNSKNGIYMGPVNTDYTIIGNDIHDNGWDGIMLDLAAVYQNPDFEEGDRIPWPDQSNNVMAQDNNIYNNAEYGISVIGEPTNDFVFDAEDNWWGDASGPHHADTNPDASGDAVTDYVDYDPWSWDASHTTSASQVGFTADVSNLIAISVTPIGIDFGNVVPGGIDAIGDTITVGNAGNVLIDLSTSLSNEAGTLYTDYLYLDTFDVEFWTAIGVGVGDSATAIPKLSGIPANFAPGNYTVTIVFWAEMAVP